MAETVFVIEIEKSGDGLLVSLYDRLRDGGEKDLITSDFYPIVSDGLYEVGKVIVAHDGWEYF